MVLLDELGVDRERFINPTTSDELYIYIEEYLLSEEERERLELNRNLCDWARKKCSLHQQQEGNEQQSCALWGFDSI